MNQTNMPLKRAKLIQQEAKHLGFTIGALDHQNWVSLYDILITESDLIQTTRQLFLHEHYAQAVEEAYKCVNNYVKRRTGSSADGASLMQTAFSLNAPVLKMNSLASSSERDQQLGYMQILAGVMTGVRNPRAHEHSYLDEPHNAFELLLFANHLMRMVSSAKRVRGKSSRSTP